MIPNTDINCSKCATPIYSDCVMWSGADLSCLLLTKDCCDTSITDVINKLGGYICNFSNVTDYMFPFCFESYSISDFKGMQQAMLTQICVMQSEIDTLEAKVGPLDFNWGCYSSGVTSSVTLAIQRLITETCTKTSLNLNWKCIPSGTTNSINDSLQAIINAESAQQISYNSSQFVVTGETGACNKGLSLTTPVWVDFSIAGTVLGGLTTGATGGAHLIDNQGNVRLQIGAIDILDTKALETYALANVGTLIGNLGYYIPVFKLPPAMYPKSGTALRTKFYVDTWLAYTAGNTNFYNSSGVTSTENAVSTFTYSSSAPSSSTVSTIDRPYKKIMYAVIIKGNIDNNWYICLDKTYFPGGVNYSSALLVQTSTVRCYLDSLTYNINN
jgi:hypothetical protein